MRIHMGYAAIFKIYIKAICTDLIKCQILYIEERQLVVHSERTEVCN